MADTHRTTRPLTEAQYRRCILYLGLAVLLAGCGENGSSVDAFTSSPDGGDASAQNDGGDTDAAGVDGGMPGPEAGVWTTLAPLARGPRQETAVVAANGEVYVIGGFDGTSTIVGIVEAYDPASNSWRDRAALPLALHHANAAVLNGKIYVLGYLVGNGFAAEGRVLEYDPVADVWADRTAMETGRERGAAATVALDGWIYVIGGFRNGSVADVDRYDPIADRWERQPPLPRTSDHIVGGVVGDKIIVAGGRSDGISRHTTRTDVFDPLTSMWTQGAEMPTSRAGCAASVSGGRLIVFGGEGNTTNPPSFVFDQTERFDATLGWSILAPMPSPRHGTGAATIGDTIYVPGGADVQALGPVATHEAFLPPP